MNGTILLLCLGLVGCMCFGAGDWLMMYGDETPVGDAFWLTRGTVSIPMWRYNLSMALAFPGTVFYGVALFAIGNFITDDKSKKIYHYLNAFGLTPWIALHLLVVMNLMLFAWLSQNGFAQDAVKICTALFDNLAWISLASITFMLPVFIYWFILQIRGKTVFPKAMAFTNVIVIFIFMKCISLLLPDSPLKIAFRNGLMSESMIIWLGIMIIHTIRGKPNDKKNL